MAPEQHLAEPVSPATDQFAFCVVVYEALCGVYPFAKDNHRPRRPRVVAAPALPPPREARLPRRVRRALVRGLSRKPAERYTRMDDLLGDLEPPAKRGLAVAGMTAAVVAVAASLAIARSGRESAAERCRRSAAIVDEVWSADHGDALKRRFVATGAAHAGETAGHVLAGLDRYVAAWKASRVEACAALHVRAEQSQRVTDLRIACHQRALTSLRALLAVLSTPTVVNTVGF